MFSDRYGLTQAVLEGKKTMTRRNAGALNHPLVTDISECGIDDKGKAHIMITYSTGVKETVYPIYQPGEEVAIGQKYIDLKDEDAFYEALQKADPSFPLECIKDEKGCYNKMFVKAEWMPHRIRITDVSYERIQDISDVDCRKEGIIHVNWRQYLKQDVYDFTPQKYKEHSLWTLPIFEESFLDSWAEKKPGEYAAESAKVAFAVLIFKLMGRKVWEQNPFVFAYEFELLR